MSEDKRVTPRSDEEVRTTAERSKSEFGVSRRRPVNILRCLESGQLWTVYGRKRLNFVVVEDSLLGEIDAKTEFSKGVVTITSKRSVRDRAQLGIGRDRMTLTHELAHATMHHSLPMFRLVGANGKTELAHTKTYSSAEHQAKVFAAAFLIHDEDAAQMPDAETISVDFGVSLQAAEICFERLRKKAERARSADRIRKIADETIAVLKRPIVSQPLKHLDDPCVRCHQRMLLPVDTRIRCDNCGFIGERYQDGDHSN